jgi:hypothetical protein
MLKKPWWLRSPKAGAGDCGGRRSGAKDPMTAPHAFDARSLFVTAATTVRRGVLERLKRSRLMTPVITAFERSPDRGRGMARDMPVRWALEEVGQAYHVPCFRSLR